MVVRSTTALPTVASPEPLVPSDLSSASIDHSLAQPTGQPVPSNPLDTNVSISRRPPKKAKLDIIEEISRTLPAGLELHRAQRFQLGNKFQIVMLKIQVPAALEPKLKEWRQNLEERFPLISVFVRRVRVNVGLASQLRSEFRDSELITKLPENQISKMITNLCGEPPPACQPRAFKPFRESLQDVPFIAIDRPDVKNPEDLIYGERKHDGRLILKVAIIDITDYIRLGSEQDKYALRVGNDYYGRKRVVSTIGSSLAEGQGCFTLNEARPAWVAELRISPAGVAEPDSFKLRRAWVKNHASVNPDEPFDVKAQPEIAPIIAALAEITRVLERQRINRSKMIAIDGEGTASRIVAETMIAANELISEHIEHTLKIPAAYIVHQEPTEHDQETWVAALSQLRIPATIEDLQNDWSKMGILRSLENHSSLLARSLENNILDCSMYRSVASSRSGPHDGLQIKGYTRLKPREALGILNQLALDAALFGKTEIPAKEINDRVETLNNKRWTRDERHYKLRFFEMLEEKLALVGSLSLGEIARVEEHVAFYRNGVRLEAAPGVHEFPDAQIAAAWEMHLKGRLLEGEGQAEPPPLPNGIAARLEPFRYHVQVEGFSKWGVIKAPESPVLKAGDPVAVILKGFNINSMRFEFEITTL